MLQIQTSLIKNHCSFSLSAISYVCDDISKAVFKNDQTLVTNYITKIQKFFTNLKQFKGKRLSQVYSLVDLFLFNLSMGLQRSRIIFEDMLVESTGTQEFDQKKVIQRAQDLKKDIKQTLSSILASQELLILLKVCKQQKRSVMIQLSNLWQTIIFLTKNYNITIPHLEEYKKESESFLMKVPIIANNQILCKNRLLFDDKSKQLIKFLQEVDPYKHFVISCILHSNEPKRSIFATTTQTHSIIQNIMSFIMKQIHNKSILIFSNEHYSLSPHCAFLVNYMVYEYGDLLVKFSSIFSKFQTCSSQSEYYSRNLTLFEQLNSLLQSYTPSHFSSFINCIFRIINQRFDTSQSVEILKLLVFNRFLLNPELINLIIPVNQQFSVHANRIKNIFFPTKLKNVQIIMPTSIASLRIFSELCQTKDNSKAKTLFLPDKILSLSYQQIKNDVSDQKMSPSLNLYTPQIVISSTSINKNLLQELDSKNYIHEYQLSFSQMMKWLSQFRMQVSHRNSERRRCISVCNDMDQALTQKFKQTGQRFKEWKQKILESKRMHSINCISS